VVAPFGGASGSPTHNSGYRGEHAVREEVPKPGLRLSVDNAVNDLVQVGALVDVVCDARRENGEDISGSFVTLVEPGK
jgi:hypothetical protein